MDSFQNVGGLMAQNNQAVETGFQFATEQAQQQADKVNADPLKDNIARFADLTGGAFIEKSGEALIKRGVKLGKDKLVRLGIKPEEFDDMLDSYKKGGSKGLIDKIVKKYGIKTKGKLQSFLSGFRDKMDNMKQTAEETTTDTRQSTQEKVSDKEDDGDKEDDDDEGFTSS